MKTNVPLIWIRRSSLPYLAATLLAISGTNSTAFAIDTGWGCLQKYTEKFTQKYVPGQYTQTAIETGFKDGNKSSEIKPLEDGSRTKAKLKVLTGATQIADGFRNLAVPFEKASLAFKHHKYGPAFELVFNLQILAQAVTGQFDIHDDEMYTLATKEGINQLFKKYPNEAVIVLNANPSLEQLANFKAKPENRQSAAYLHLVNSQPFLHVAGHLAMATNLDGVVDLLMDAYIEKGLLCQGQEGVMKLDQIVEVLAKVYPNAM